MSSETKSIPVAFPGVIPPPPSLASEHRVSSPIHRNHHELGSDAATTSTRFQREKMEALCSEFGLPLPQEVYIVPRVYYPDGNANLTVFDLTIPKGLRKWVDDSEFEFTVAKINSHFEKAERIGCKMVCCCLFRFLTCNVIRLCKMSKMERTLLKIQAFIHQQNQDVYHPKGLHIVDPRTVGLRHIEIKSISYEPIKHILEQERAPVKVEESEFQRFFNQHRSSRVNTKNTHV